MWCGIVKSLSLAFTVLMSRVCVCRCRARSLSILLGLRSERLVLCFFFFKQRPAYEWLISVWSSDVCSSDLDDAAAGVDHGPLGGQQHLHGLLDLPLVALVDRRVRAHADLALGGDILAGLQADIFGDVDQHRPGPPGAGDVERPSIGST